MDKYNRGTKYLDKNRPEKAIPLFKAQIKEHEFKEVWLNLGNAYRLQNKDDLARAAYLKATSNDMPTSEGRFPGQYDLALNNLGLLCFKHGQNDEAIEYYEQCLRKNPHHYDAVWNYAIALLRKGCSGEKIDWPLAWRMYEYRFKKENPIKLTGGIAPWDGISFAPRLVVMAEQGMGDKIMFGRYVHELKKFADEVIVECPPGMEGLFNAAGVTGFTGRYNLPGAVGIPICSLAARFGFGSPEWLHGLFKPREDLGNGIKIGIVWSGSATHANNYNRSCNVALFKRFAKYGKLYSLSIDAPDVKGVEKLSSSSWADTCSNVLAMDLVISIDTSIVHLAGSLGVPCFMVQPLHETDFRWGNKPKSPWYNSVTSFENKGWETAFVNIEAAVKEYFDPVASLIRDVMADPKLLMVQNDTQS